jgi:hypothetical protein
MREIRVVVEQEWVEEQIEKRTDKGADRVRCRVDRVRCR